MTRQIVLLTALTGILAVALLPHQAEPAPPPVVVLETHEPVNMLAKGLEMFGAPQESSLQAATVLYRQAMDQGVDPALVAAIMTVENPRLVPSARSSAGAVGLMQVMPFWKESASLSAACGLDLTDIDTNVCYGIRILQIHVEQGGSLRRGLLHYNGCKLNPTCRTYPDLVLRRHRMFGVLARGLAD